LPFFLILLLRKKFIIILPFILILPLWSFRESAKLETIFERGFSSHGAEHFSLTERLYLWQAGLKIWIDHPLLGTGAADYGQIYQKYRSPNATGVAKKGSHQHNDYINTIVLYGSLGFTIYILFFIFPFYTFFKKYKILNHPFSDPNHKYLIWGSLTALVMFLVMGTSQCHFTDEEVQAVLWITIGIFYRSNLKLLDKNL